jgi:hypothetical protein
MTEAAVWNDASIDKPDWSNLAISTTKIPIARHPSFIFLPQNLLQPKNF